ncbi:MAG: MarC family protein [Stenomitos rutilans HA7619-LM2]|nr:MarC family protein [Stenomitos rutilans HA7619-LM2]
MIQSLTKYSLGTFVALFPIANPIGAAPVFYSLTEADSDRYRMQQARMTAINVIWLLAAFFLIGKFILAFFGISLGVLRIAGGLLVGHTAWEMVTARQRLNATEHQDAQDKDDISFTPMAVPLIGGPGAIGVVIGMSERATQVVDYVGCLVGIGLLGIVLYLCLVLGETLAKRMSSSGLGALNRVLGFFILAIAVQFVADGVADLVKQAVPSLR